MQDDPRDETGDTPSIDSLGGMLLVLFAMPVGYVLLLSLAVPIARRAPWTFSMFDVLLWGCALAIPLAQRRVARCYAAVAATARPRALLPSLAGHLVAAAILWSGAQSVHLLA